MGTVTWQYSDWRSQSTPAKQLERLKLHMQEVEAYLVESNSKGRTVKLSDTLLPLLQKNPERLETQVALATALGTRGVSRFVRGTS